MSRWRPPQARSSPYITPQGHLSLKQELKDLWSKRRVVNNALAAAAAEGDRSENAEYIYRKKEQAGIDRRIRYLQKRIPDLKVIDRVGNTEQCFFGATVELENQDGEVFQYRIVGPDETDAKLGHISIDSPLAKALLKKRVGDQASISIADRAVDYDILAINYQGLNEHKP